MTTNQPVLVPGSPFLPVPPGSRHHRTVPPLNASNTAGANVDGQRLPALLLAGRPAAHGLERRGIVPEVVDGGWLPQQAWPVAAGR